MNYIKSTRPTQSRSSGPPPDITDQWREAEQTILGQILWKPELIDQVKLKLSVDDLQYGKHQLIYRAMLNLYEKRIPIDVLTLWEHLEQINQLEQSGGSSYLTYLTTIALNKQIKKDNKETDQILYWLRNNRDKEH